MNEWPKVDGLYSPKVDETKFKEILSNFFCESIDIPDDLLDTHQEQECYLSFCPFYRYDVEFRANWTADIGYYYTVEKQVYNESTKKFETKTERHTRWEPGQGTVEGEFLTFAPAVKSLQEPS